LKLFRSYIKINPRKIAQACPREYFKFMIIWLNLPRVDLIWYHLLLEEELIHGTYEEAAKGGFINDESLFSTVKRTDIYEAYKELQTAFELKTGIYILIPSINKLTGVYKTEDFIFTETENDMLWATPIKIPEEYLEYSDGLYLIE